MIRVRLLFLTLLLLGAACAGAPPAPELSAEELYRQAEQAVEARDAETAQKLLDRELGRRGRASARGGE